MIHVYSCIYVKYIISTCFCSEYTVKTHENTSQTLHFMYKNGTCLFLYVIKYTKSTDFCCENTLNLIVHVYYCTHMKCTKSTCFCTSKTVYIMYKECVESRHRDALLLLWQLIRFASRLLFLCLESPI
jgi:hypothetical protein